MRVGGIVLGRLSSSRLPGKVLRELAGRPLVAHVLRRLERVEGLDVIVVATSRRPEDDALAAWCEANGVLAFRGALDDVADRILACADEHGLDAVARVNADSPWLDPELLGRAVALIRAGGHDLVTNVLERTWPYGISAEVMTVDALRRAHALSDDPEEAEHVTRLIYARPERFSILNLRSDLDQGGLSSLRFTVDTEQDLQRCERLAAALGARLPIAGTEELIETSRRLERSIPHTR